MSHEKSLAKAGLASRKVLSPLGTGGSELSRTSHDASKEMAATLPGCYRNISNFRQLSLRSMNEGSSGSHEFELMNIKITVLGLSGILIDQQDDLDSVSTYSRSKGKFKLRKKRPTSILSTAESVQSSITSVGDENLKENNDSFYAVITHNRNLNGRSLSIDSHLPSIPFAPSNQNFGSISRHNAEWPANNATPLLDEKSTNNLVAGSSFSLERVMRRESFDYQKTRATSNVNNFIHETIDLRIQLKYGSEMIPVGVASFVVTGEEDVPVKMIIPAKPIRFRKKKMVVVDPNAVSMEKSAKKELGNMHKKGIRERRKLNKKVGELPTFSSVMGTTVTLDENASLSISVQSIPLASIKEAEKAKERHLFKEQRRKERIELQQQQQIYVKKQMNDLENQAARANKISEAKKRQKSSIFAEISEIFCHSVGLLDSPAADETFNNPPGKLNDYVSPQNELGQEKDYFLGQKANSFESSVLSSVSESESESESEDEAGHMNKTIVLEKRLYET
eukprot:CAMPEP_0194251178 /NCGR_PEP_ID=MMETSP0158-20130606/24829_1 /TAXON_ID=33649 /ORGANISM="Thalassionema nitzschioides, Strain L26-B" /LENGTH=507 /DNA_ID=CAMNT_0038988235 /DNA_START=83 /DNA_END=1606 /DNA_ORIENTATION=-